MSKRIGIALLCILMLVALVYAEYDHNRKSSYKYRALEYMEKFDSSITFKYVDESPEEWLMLVGTVVTVRLMDVNTGQIWNVTFRNGKIQPKIESK